MGPETLHSVYDDFLEERLVRLSPFPSISSAGVLRDGIALGQPTVCRTCTDRKCADLYELADRIDYKPLTCHRGVSIIAMDLRSTRVIVNGVFTPQTFAALHRRAKKECWRHRIRLESVREWRDDVNQWVSELAAIMTARVEDTLGMLHDVQTAVSSLLRSAEEYVSQQPGGTFEQKIEQMTPSAVALVKAVQLLHARLGLLPLLVNPDAARYGQKHATPVYRIVDRVIHVMRAAAQKYGVNLKLTGTSFNSPHGFDSFETVPLVLIDNAIKYSRGGQKVEVFIEDVPSGVHVIVRSFSPQISAGQRSSLFERGFRGEYARQVSSRGSGLGLYLAKIVADAHGFQINHFSDNSVVTIGGIPYCNNSFEFTLSG